MHARRLHGMQGFAAVKLTALGNPLLLKRVSTAIQEVRVLFEKWDTDGNQVRQGRLRCGVEGARLLLLI